MPEEVFLSFPAPSRDRVLPTTRVKGTWVASAMRSLKASPYFEAYTRELDAATLAAMLAAMPGDWLDIALLLTHYDACDRLAIPADQIALIARETIHHAQGGVLAVSARAASSIATPWTLLAQLHRFWHRLFMGGGAAVFKLGPKEARVELVGFPGCRSLYCRISTRSIAQTAFEFISRRAYVSELPRYKSSSSMALRVAWV